MILVIPSVDIKDGKCVRTVQNIPGIGRPYSDDPEQVAILWRGENAKMIHVADLDGARESVLKNMDLIRKVIQAVDIPIQVSGGIQTYDQVSEVLEAGAGRIVLSTAAAGDRNLIKRLLSEFGPRKIVFAVHPNGGPPLPGRAQEDSVEAAISLALSMKALGLERILYADRSRDGSLSGPNITALKTIAENTQLKITASGGVAGYPDLKRMQDLEPLGVDSVIVGRALYENRFPCQELWRKCELELEDFGPTRRV